MPSNDFRERYLIAFSFSSHRNIMRYAKNPTLLKPLTLSLTGQQARHLISEKIIVTGALLEWVIVQSYLLPLPHPPSLPPSYVVMLTAPLDSILFSFACLCSCSPLFVFPSRPFTCILALAFRSFSPSKNGISELVAANSLKINWNPVQFPIPPPTVLPFPTLPCGQDDRV